ncbi:MAG: hypothetical protein WC784_03725 [Candidatus Shapirobacteria bacterium]|jgi:hypothetical protein
MKKSTIFLLILLAIFFTSTLYLLYLNFNKPSTPTTGVIPTETIVPTIDPTADWQTYTNTAFGISFKYPDSGYSICPESDFLSIFQEKNLDCNGIVYEIPLISFRNYYTVDFSKQMPISTRKVNIDKVQIIINKYQFVSTSYDVSTTKIIEIATIPLKEKNIQFYAFGNKSNFQESEDLFSQILSTFKFTP